MSGRLLHYSDAPIEAVYSTDAVKAGRDDKPFGLWLSVEGEHDWRSWCEAESYGNPSGQFCYEITLASDANILRLSTVTAILQFAKKYEFDPYAGLSLSTLMSRFAVDWRRVAAKYDGIIIAPYQWELRHDDRTSWYYGWDCASGCIWNAHAVASLTLISEPEEQRATA